MNPGQSSQVGDGWFVHRTVTAMPRHPVPLGVPARTARRLVEHLEAADAAAGLVGAADDAQLRSIYQEQRRLLGTTPGKAELGLVLACAAELSRRALNLDPRSGQLLVAASLAEGYFVEFPTGEGKTLAVAMANLWLAARHGSVHVATANTYLADRDASAMAPLYEAAGLGVAHVNVHSEDRASSYRSDVVYGTLAQFASDILTDGLVTNPSQLTRPRTGALVVDEADALLVDGALQPFSITGRGRTPVDLQRYWELAERLEEAKHYSVDRRRRTVWLEPDGIELIEGELGGDLYSRPAQVQWVHAALIVRSLYNEDHQFVVVEGKPVLLDPFSGRPRPNARLSQGLHPMLETAAGVSPGPLPVTFAQISARSVTTRYEHLSGTGGTLACDRDELQTVYARKTLVVPPHLPSRLVQHPDRVYVTRTAKLDAVAAEAAARHQQGQPVLIGTSSVEDAETVSAGLTLLGVEHASVSAKDHHREAEIITNAGRPGSVTVAARLAGRGVDIVVGDNIEAGLCVIATERFTSRREDRQMQGRAARGGAPGEAITFVSCEDDLVTMYGGSALQGAVERLRGGDAEQLLIPGIAPLLDRAQQQLESMQSTRRAEQLTGDLLYQQISERFEEWRRSLLESADLQETLVRVYRHQVREGSKAWRRRVGAEQLGEMWPSGQPVPAGDDQGETLGRIAYQRLEDTAVRDVGAERAPGALAAIVEAVLEIADSEWSRFIAETELIIGSEANRDRRALSMDLSVTEQEMWQRLDTRIARVAWGASFKARGDVPPGAEGSPSGS